MSDWVPESDAFSGQCAFRRAPSTEEPTTSTDVRTNVEKASPSRHSSALIEPVQHEIQTDRFLRDAKKFREMQWWLLRNGAEFSAIDIQMLDNERGAGIVATRDIARGEVVAVIPLATMVTSSQTALHLKREFNVSFGGYHERTSVIMESQNATRVGNTTTAPNSTRSRSRTELYQYWREHTALSLAVQRLDGAAGSFHHPYIAALPEEHPHLPIYWSSKQRSLLLGSVFAEIVEKVERSFEQVRTPLPTFTCICAPQL